MAKLSGHVVRMETSAKGDGGRNIEMDLNSSDPECTFVRVTL
jgi:hypothetical protein